MTSAERKRLRAEIPALRTFGCHDVADRLEAMTRTRKAPAKPLPGVSLKAKREGRRAAHREETAAIRVQVMARANGHCEHCHRPFTYADPPHLHHLKGGNGRRRQQQSASNCQAIHMTCHRAIHSGRRDS